MKDADLFAMMVIAWILVVVAYLGVRRRVERGDR